MSLICVADMQPGSFASENEPGISNAIAARAATVLAYINPPGPHDLSGFSGMPLDWLGGLDSNQDNQIQNLMYCQLYDLPTGAENKSGPLARPKFSLTGGPNFVNRAARMEIRFRAENKGLQRREITAFANSRFALRLLLSSLSVNHDRNPDELAVQRKRYSKALARLSRFHHLILPGNHRGHGKHAMIGKRADFRFEIACDHVAQLPERIANRGLIGRSVATEHKRGELRGRTIAETNGEHAAKRAGQPDHGGVLPARFIGRRWHLLQVGARHHLKHFQRRAFQNGLPTGLGTNRSSGGAIHR